MTLLTETGINEKSKLGEERKVSFQVEVIKVDYKTKLQ